MLFVFKNGQFQGRFLPRAAIAHIHKGSRSLTVAQAIAEGWDVTYLPKPTERK